MAPLACRGNNVQRNTAIIIAQQMDVNKPMASQYHYSMIVCMHTHVYGSPASAPVTCVLGTGQRSEGHVHTPLRQLESVVTVKRCHVLFIKAS